MGCKRLHGVQNRQFLPKNLKNPHIFKDFWLFSKFGGVHGVHGVHLYTPLLTTATFQVFQLFSVKKQLQAKQKKTTTIKLIKNTDFGKAFDIKLGQRILKLLKKLQYWFPGASLIDTNQL